MERHNGRIQKAYAITNPKEYFAESSEARFGRNDFFPCNRQELQQHDPEIARLMDTLWQLPENQPTETN